MLENVVREAADQKRKHFKNLLSSINEKMASVSADTRTVKWHLLVAIPVQ
jgi:hypothetical protein